MSEPEYAGHQHHGGFLSEAIDHLEPIPVHLVKDSTDDVVKSDAGDFGAGDTQVTGPGIAPTQILAQNPKRIRCIVLVRPAASAGNSVVQAGTFTTPPAASGITSVTIPATGSYTFTASSSYGATGDVGDNTQLFNFTQGKIIAPLPSASGPNTAPIPVTVTTSANAGDVIVVKNIAAGAAGSIYNASISAVQQASTAGAVYIGSQRQMNSGAAQYSGMKLVNGDSITLQLKGEVWLAGDGINSLSVSVWDERYQ